MSRYGGGDGPEFDLLFYRGRGSDAREAQIRSALQQIDRISDEVLLRDSADQLVRETVSDHAISVPVLQRENTEFERRDRNMRRRDAWGDIFEGPVPTYYFEIPFTGDAEIFQLQPNTFNFNPPRGAVRGNTLVVSVFGTEDAAQIKREADSTIQGVEEYLGWHRQLWSGYAEELTKRVSEHLNNRIQRAKQTNATNSGLASFGFKPKR